MIPSTNNKLLVSEDWKKIYQSFRNADFKSYDFDTLRRTMIRYLQENYPEDFNDFIESSEYIALIDLIAYLGQNLSFRIDLNARENFLETAQRRDSILRLAQLISYIPKRNVPANGFLKITAIATTDSVIDSNGINLSNTIVAWNDPTNTSWYQQFITILNSTMGASYSFGKPYDRATIDGILTEQYRIQSSNADIPLYSFLKNIGGTSMNFEIVPCSFTGSSTIYEEAPKPRNTFSIVYKNDNQGPGSADTGFFAHFRQGELAVSTFSLDHPVANEIVGINASNINNTDVWLWQLNADGTYPTTTWVKVPDIVGNNVIYNSLSNNQRNIFSVSSRDQDQIDLNFADGSFGNLPKGTFKIFYRQSNGLSYTINPEQMSGIVVDIPYYNKKGQKNTLTLTLGLQYPISNSSPTETSTSIQNKAPQIYYTQNRMVTGEDYNVYPLTLGSEILKVKSVNRISSGLSKYFDLSDVSGKYSKTNIFATDGILYKDVKKQSFTFEFSNRNDIFAAIKNYLEPVLSSPSLKSFYFDQYPRPVVVSGIEWYRVTKESEQSTGYFKNSTEPLNVGDFAADQNNLEYVKTGALIKFVPPTGKYFKSNGSIVNVPGNNTSSYLWLKVIQITGDGSNTGQGALDDGTGPVILSGNIDSGAIPTEIIPKFIDVYTYAFETELVNLCMNKRNFGLTFNKTTREWNIIYDTNLNLVDPFNLSFQGAVDNSNNDSSWLIAFTWTGIDYEVLYRITDYIFESDKETSFFTESNTVNFDFTNNTVIKDQINVLSINTVNTSTSISLGKDYQWQIDGSVIEIDGFVNPKKIKISFYDQGFGKINDPDTFENIVQSTTVSPYTKFKDKFVYFETLQDGTRYQLVNSDNFIAVPTPEDAGTNIENGQLFYFYGTGYNVVNQYIKNNPNPWVYVPKYFAYPGRANIKFQYVHNSSEDRRIDPSKSNIIDIFLLTAAYDASFRNWLSTGAGSEPLAPTSQSLELSYASQLEHVKTISDELVFHPVKYKVLFGSKADVNLQATFKAVRNSSRPVSDNDLKSRILSAIDSFFSLENWDFGQNFNFSELSTYVMNELTPDITNFVIVPNSNNNFGSLYEVACMSNELFISGASASNIEIIDAITASQLKSSSIVTTSGS